jgi:tetratricopeptide (TPR) repeat protein
MNTRIAMISGVGLLAALAATGVIYWQNPGSPVMEASADEENLPIPPVPPRIAQGETYERCLSLLDTDPAAASAMAAGWRDGGDGATHCLALSRIALGQAGAGAQMLEHLAGESHAPAAVRAIIFGQATQAWLVAGKPDRAFGAATLALSLSPDDADLLIDRAVTAAAMDRPQDSVDDLTRVLAIDPRRVDALTDRAAALRRMGRLDLAQDDIDRAMSIDMDNPEALLERGILRQRRDDRLGARTDWQRAIDLAPDTPTADLAEQNLALLAAGPDRK